ncbi:MAG TPA: C40 family peptidase [Firmicutes bacterium]|nr:C40 family peptidase [Candidatus Fermentithermobacillaceae bacterium]
MKFEDFIGIPFRFRGRGKDGIDCLGLVCAYQRYRGYYIPDGDGLPMEHDRQPDYMDRAMKSLSKYCVQVEEVEPGDIILMRLPGGYTHMGVMVDETNMLHVLKDRPSGIEPVLKYGRRVVAVFRPTTPLRRRSRAVR